MDEDNQKDSHPEPDLEQPKTDPTNNSTDTPLIIADIKSEPKDTQLEEPKKEEPQADNKNLSLVIKSEPELLNPVPREIKAEPTEAGDIKEAADQTAAVAAVIQSITQAAPAVTACPPSNTITIVAQNNSSPANQPPTALNNNQSANTLQNSAASANQQPTVPGHNSSHHPTGNSTSAPTTPHIPLNPLSESNSSSNQSSLGSKVNPHHPSGHQQAAPRQRYIMRLEERTVVNFKVAKLFRENNDRINSIDFSSNGETLITSSDDDSIVIYDCEKGTMRRSVNSKKYGVDLIHYTHAANTAIHSSNKVDDTIRYLSLHDNKYIRYFPGHTKKVVTLCMSPVDDTFLSGSLDKTIRLWDLRSPNCQGLMHLLGRPVANFDPEGLIFAVGINSESVKLYDLRSFDKGPFNTFKIPQDTTCDWTGLKFSPDGKIIMIYTNGSIIHTLDGFQGMPLQTLTGHVNNKGVNLEASFSPDSQFIFSGSTDGRIYVWNALTGSRVAILQGDNGAAQHSAPVQCVQFSPKYMMLASACSNMAFWVPQLSLDNLENTIM